MLLSFFHAIKAKGWKHWVWAAGLIIIGEVLSYFLAEHEPLLSIRYAAYQLFQNHGPREVKSRYTAVITVDDAAFYQSGFTPGSPIERSLLAALVSKAALHKPAVIVLDFDLCTGNEQVVTPAKLPDRTIIALHEYPARATDALKLATAIDAVAAKQPFILSEEIGETKVADKWVRLFDVYEDYAFRNTNNITTAHIRLDTDARKIPAAAQLQDGGSVKSISIAAAEAFNKALSADESSNENSFAGFMKLDRLPTVSAADVLKEDASHPDEAISARLEHRVVLIGGSWHVDGDHRGQEIIDSHNTPLGVIPGVFAHANYIESLLDSRLLTNGGTVVVDLLVAVVSAIVLAVPTVPWKRWMTVMAVVTVPIILCYGSVVLWGIYFDVLLVDILLIGHIVAETVHGWYLDHVKYRKCVDRS